VTVDDRDVMASVAQAIRGGDVAAVARMLGSRPEIATARGPGGRTALHVVTDWPGYYPHGPEMVRLFLAASADPDARTSGKRAAETPLHWAASNDDWLVAEALIDGGADVEAPDGSIGTPLANAIGYGCWNVARLLVARGARATTLWEAAALGLQSRVEDLMAVDPPPDRVAITEAFWQACHGGQRRTAEYLLGRGADIHGVPGYSEKAAIGIAGEPDTSRQLLVAWLREHGAVAPTD
jgi:ankyrin repeat protein